MDGDGGWGIPPAALSELEQWAGGNRNEVHSEFGGRVTEGDLVGSCPIPRLQVDGWTGLSVRDFLRDYVEARKPVFLRGTHNRLLQQACSFSQGRLLRQALSGAAGGSRPGGRSRSY